MSPRLSVFVGLLVGIVAGALVLGGIVAFAPEPAPPAPSPTPTASAAPVPSASGPAVASAVPSPSSGPSGSPGAFHVGEPAPALVVPQVGGGTIDLAALRGKAVWVNFMATWCPSCQDEFPLMAGYAARYADDGLVVVAVDVREDEGTVASFAQGLGATFPIGLDSDGAAAASWDAVTLPVHFWIDTDGIIRDGALGGIGPDVMAAGLQKILPGVTVTP